MRLDDDGLVYVGYVRTHRLRWGQVSSLEVSTVDSSSPFESVGVVVHLRGGGEVGLVSLAGVAVSGRVERLDRLVRECDHRRGAST